VTPPSYRYRSDGNRRTAIAAHKSMHHHTPQGNAGCKGEFMQMKDGKCIDAHRSLIPR
jgi:hypothetical protein